jgi:MerR family transcriptional regulator, light-induced transcriptional regulator
VSNEAGRFKIGALSGITGLKPELLRAWQRRFQLFEPERTQGGQRLYTPDDVRVAVYVRDLLAKGRSIGAVARQGRTVLVAEARKMHPDVPGGGVSALFPEDKPEPAPSESEWPGLVKDLVQGALRIEPTGVEAALEVGFRGCVEDILVRLVCPAMHRIGDLWERGECSVAGEHLVATMVRDRLFGLMASASPPAGSASPEAIVACLPDDVHENGALTAAVRLGCLGWQVTWLGAALPIPDLDRACRSLRPHAVYLSVTLGAHFDASRPALLAFARRWQGAFEVVLGGPGVPIEDPDLAAAGVRLSRDWTPPGQPEGWTQAG